MRSSDYREIARLNISGKWGTAILTALLASILGGLLVDGNLIITFEINETTTFTTPNYTTWIINTLGIGFMLTLIRLAVGGVTRLGYATFLLKQYDGLDADPEELLNHYNRFWDGFLLSLLTFIFVFLWSLLLLIPGLIAALKYSMAPFILAENPGMTPSEALDASKNLMYGHKWELFCLILSFIGWMLLSAITFGLLSLYVTPYMNAAHAAFYRQISRT